MLWKKKKKKKKKEIQHKLLSVGKNRIKPTSNSGKAVSIVGYFYKKGQVTGISQ